MTIAHVVIPPTHNAERINPDEFCIVKSFQTSARLLAT